MRSQLLQTLLMLTNLQALLLLIMLAAFATSQSYPPIAKSGCVDSCGDLSIPYPFGITQECYESLSFWVTCNSTKLFWQASEVEIINISHLGQMTVMQFISRNCYDAQSQNVTSNKPYIMVPQFFTVNNEANKFTIVGCDSFGFIFGKRDDRNYQTGCTATCLSTSDLEDGSCFGSGCCQIPIPKNVWQVNVTVKSYRNYSDVKNISPCSYGFLVDNSAFNFSRKTLTNLKGVEKLPMVVDWAIGNVTTCEEAQKNPSDYACKSENSHCQKPDNGYGYRCYCNSGYDGNPYLPHGCQDIDECSSKQHVCEHAVCENTPGSYKCICDKGYHGDGMTNGTGCKLNVAKSTIVAGVIPTGLVLLVIACLAYMVYNRGKSKREWFIQNGGKLLRQDPPIRPSGENFRIFNLSALRKATNDFHDSNIVNEGVFDMIYRGVLSDNTTVAITKSNIVNPKRKEEWDAQFVKEVNIHFQISHENIFKLLGCCFESKIPHLVYEFIRSDTLATHLHDTTKGFKLHWEKRLRIAIETAEVLLHLHTSPNSIIHGDVKSDNILLMDNYTAKVAHFGLSRLISFDKTKIFTVTQEARGYLDPEYFRTGELSTKSDVYSFGVILLELLTGKEAFNPNAKERSLVAHSQSKMKQDKFEEIIDGNIAGKGHVVQVKKVTELAELCVNMNEYERPDMEEIVERLEDARQNQ